VKRILLALACLLGLVCATNNWQFNVGGRVLVYQIVEATFLGLFTLAYLTSRSKPALSPDAKSYVALIWAWMSIVCLSGVVVLVAPIGPGALTQYTKGFVSILSQTLFITALVAFLCELTASERHVILRFFVAGVMLSCVYELMQTIGMKYGVNFDALIWDRISYNTLRDADEAFIGRFAWNDFFRGAGFPGGPNSQAAYIATALPLLLVNALGFRPRVNMLFIVVAVTALLITMSRSGIVAIATALLVLVVLGNRRTARVGKPLIVVALVLAVPAFIFWESIIALAGTRAFYDASRLSVYANALEILSSYPLGIGFNTFYVADVVFSIGETNAHNNWLAYFVETGLAGLLCKAAFFFFLCTRLLGSANVLRIGVLASTIGLVVAALFNENLDQFFAELFFALFFVTAMLDPERQSYAPGRITSRAPLPLPEAAGSVAAVQR
jgi:hypothetical protein